jgi:hypothetical protein
MVANVEVIEVELAAMDDKVIGHDDARHGSEEDTPAGDDAAMGSARSVKNREFK